MDSSDNSRPGEGGNNQIELQNMNHKPDEPSASEGATSTMVESSMDIEQSMPTVAEVRGKSDREDEVVDPRKRKLLVYSCMAAPFLLVAIIVLAVVLVTKESNKGHPDDLRTMDKSQSFQRVVEYLGNHSISSIHDIARSGSPQNEAVKWLAHEDDISLRIPLNSPASKDGYEFIQRYIMAVFYYSMGGPVWKYSLNFLAAENTCDWFSLIVTARWQLPMGVRCTSNGLIQQIVMSKWETKFNIVVTVFPCSIPNNNYS